MSESPAPGPASRGKEGGSGILPLRQGRRIEGISAVLLPFDANGDPALDAFESLLERTVAAGLVPAVNMDTGFVQWIDVATRLRVLEVARSVASEFVAGVFVADKEGSAFDSNAYRKALDEVTSAGGLPIVFPSWGLGALDGDGWLDALVTISADVDSFLAFELGEMFVPYGRIYGLETYRGLLGIKKCLGAKHSSLARELEWQRLQLRDEVRPDFKVYTGNDLAIDMVQYGSDYLLGLSTFAPDAFALRDRFWREGDRRFYELNDLLQYLGQYAFRPPVPAYRHTAAQFLELRGWLETPHPAPGTPRRNPTDLEVLRKIEQRLRAWVS